MGGDGEGSAADAAVPGAALPSTHHPSEGIGKLTPAPKVIQHNLSRPSIVKAVPRDFCMVVDYVGLVLCICKGFWLTQDSYVWEAAPSGEQDGEGPGPLVS